MKTVSVAEMRELDRRTIQEAGIEGAILMERAGIGAAEHILEFASFLNPAHARRFVILSGKGNNGGDAFVVARHLFGKSAAKVAIFAVCPIEELSGDARTHAQRTPGEIPCEIRRKLYRTDFRRGDIIIDGLLGTGVSGPPREPYSQWIEIVNSLNLPVVSLDLPSGLDADTGNFTLAVRADLTITMGLPKKGFVAGAAQEILGVVRLVDIGIPENFIGETVPGVEMIFESDIRKFLGRIPALSHKRSRGSVCVVGGSSLYPGAPFLSGSAALRSGCGLATVAVPDSASISGPAMLALITRRIKASSGGIFSEQSAEEAVSLVKDADCTVIGPGLGRASEIFVGKLSEASRRAVIDADALNILAEFPEKIKISPDSVLTPHPGEMRRLLKGFGLDNVVEADRIAQASSLAARLKCVVVLKGHQTVVASAGRVSVNSSGTPALASAGTGDVLAGVIASFIAQGLEPYDAAASAVFIHGLAAELSPHGRRGMVADDLLTLVPEAMKAVSPFA